MIKFSLLCMLGFNKAKIFCFLRVVIVFLIYLYVLCDEKVFLPFLQLQIMRPKQKERGKSSSEIALNKKIVAPDKLKILVLAGNDLLNQHLQFLTKCVNLVKLDISHNHINRLPEREALCNLSKLQVVFLHYNKISNIEGLRSIYCCSSLVHLTYHHNPIEVHIKNEHQIVNSLPNLKLLNSRVVFLQERTNIIFPVRNNVYADQTFLESWKSTENSEVYYLKVLSLQLNYISHFWSYHNPIIIIQRAWKLCLRQKMQINDMQEGISLKKVESSKRGKRKQVNNQLNQKDDIMRKAFIQWKRWSFGLQSVKQTLKKCVQREENGKKYIDKSYLGWTLQEYKREVRNMKVRKPLAQFLGKIRKRIYERRMAERLVASIRLKQILFAGDRSFYNISGVKENNKIYYNRNQQHLLDNFLQIIGEKLGKELVSSANCRPTKRYSAIRLVDPETYANRFHSEGVASITSLLWPSMKMVICQRKRGVSAFKGGIIGTKQLSYIKNRNKVLTKAEFKKSSQVYHRLEKFALNEYQNSLWQFSCSEEEVMRHLIRILYYHNCKALQFEVKSRKSEMLALMRNYQQPLMIYVDEVVKRTAAAVLIQKTWRRYVSNKSQPESIYHKINKNRAALHIQKFYRNYRYFHRLRFNKAINQNLASLTTSTILYPLFLYLQLDTIEKQRNRNRLFKQLRLSRGNEGVGASEEFYRPIFQKRIRDVYFGGRMIGTENYESEINLYNLLHYKVQVSLVQSNIGMMVQLIFPSQVQANIATSLMALLTYQPRGSQFIWPFTLTGVHTWPQQLQLFQKISFLSANLVFPPKSNKAPAILAMKPISTKGTFIYKEQEDIPEGKSNGVIKVQFYQKKYHNFPVKHQQTLRYMQNEVKEIKNTQQKHQTKNLQNTQVIKQAETKMRFASDGAISIRTIDKEKFSLFQDQSKSKKIFHDQTAFLNKTVSVLQERKKQIKKHYKEEELKRQAQKEIKQTSLSVLREKAKQEKMLNTTLKNLKQAQRTQQLRNKVKRIKQIKQQTQKSNQEQDFVQQNNFVMQQQLKMIMMRAHIKESEQKKEEHSQKKSSFNHHTQHFTPSLHSRHSETRKAPIQQQEKIEEIGEEGSVVNVRKKVRRGRAQSIGAYVRDPSFVHGVFPEEYYPIQNRATKFYFPPVL